MNAIEQIILRKLEDGPAWSQSFRHVKPVVVRMVERGVIVRVAPTGSNRRNMLALATKDQTND